MCHLIIEQKDSGNKATAPELAKRISLLDAIHLLNGAWEDLEPVSIRNCWGKGGLKMGRIEQPICDTEDVPVPIENWESWMEMDADLPVVAPVSDDDIITQVMEHDDVITISDDYDDESDEEAPPPTSQQMRNALNVLQRGLWSRGFEDLPLLKKFERSVNSVLTDSMPQKRIDEFFGIFDK